MRINLPSGENKVSFVFSRTPLRLTAEIISLSGLMTVVFLFIKSFRRKKVKNYLKKKGSGK